MNVREVGSRLFTAIVMMILFSWSGGLLNSGGDLSPEVEQRLRYLIDNGRHEIAMLRNASSNVSIADLGLTNVRPLPKPGGHTLYLPESMEERLLKFWEPHPNGTAYFRNISASLTGRYRIKNQMVDKVPMQLPALFSNDTLRNHTIRKVGQETRHGRMNLEFRQSEYTAGGIGELSASMEGPGSYFYRLYGVYLDDGRFVLATRSLKFSGDLAIPFMLPDHYRKSHFTEFNHTRALLADRLNRTLAKVEENNIGTYIDRMERAAETCELVVFGHIRPAKISQDDLDRWDDEFRNPTGQPLPPLPHLRMGMAIYSPDCGLLMFGWAHGDVTGVLDAAHRWLLLWLIAAVLAAMMATLYNMGTNRAPSAMAKISSWTQSLMMVVDMGYVILSIGMSDTQPGGIMLLVCAAMLAAADRMYLGAIVQAQGIEPGIIDMLRVALRVPNQAQLATPIEGVVQTGQIEPASETQTQQTTSPGSRDIEGVMGLSQGFVLVFYLVFILSTIMNWKLVSYPAVFLAFSFWVPQIFRNAFKGYRKPVPLLHYAIPVSVCRLAPFVYFCFADPLINHDYLGRQLGWTLMAWMAVQLLVMGLQRLVGPQFFLPLNVVIPVYDYHPIIDHDMEQALDIAGADEVAESSDADVNATTVLKELNCPICMNMVQVEVARGDAAVVPRRRLLARRNYMVTPCRHVYHTHCLEQWMDSSLNCPVCRNHLPPL